MNSKLVILLGEEDFDYKVLSLIADYPFRGNSYLPYKFIIDKI
jgi:hypothetical protein